MIRYITNENELHSLETVLGEINFNKLLGLYLDIEAQNENIESFDNDIENTSQIIEFTEEIIEEIASKIKTIEDGPD